MNTKKQEKIVVSSLTELMEEMITKISNALDKSEAQIIWKMRKVISWDTGFQVKRNTEEIRKKYH